jgi:hypothetical protein
MGEARDLDVLIEHFDAELEPLLSSGVEHPHGTRDAVVETAEESRDLIERALRRGEADALERAKSRVAT